MQFNKKLIVFPTSRAIREYILTSSFNNTLLPTFLSIDDFFKKSITIGTKEFIDEDQRFLFLKEASNINELKKLGLSNSFSEFIKHSDYLFRFFGEIAAEKVNIEDIKNVDTYEYYIEHLEILQTIHSNYCEILKDNNAVDKINLNDNYKINSSYLKSFEDITIFFEGYFTNSEFDILQKVSEISEVKVNLKATEYNQKSIEKFKILGFKIEVGFEYLLNLKEKLIISKDKLKNSNKNISIESFSSRVNQIAFIKKSITSMIDKGLEKNKIVLILPDENMKQSLELFDNEKYFNYAMGNDISSSNLYKTIYSITRYLNDNEKLDLEFLNFLKLDESFVNMSIKPIWKEGLKRDSFNKILEFIKSYENDVEIIEKFDELIYKINHLFFKKEQKISLKEALKILMQRVNKITLDDVNSGAITVMGLLESRAVKFDGVIICDFNESFVPKRSVKDKFLSSSVKHFAKLPTLLDRESLQKYYYSQLLNKAKEIAISYVQNETMQISRFANELFDKKLISHQSKDEEYKHILYNQKKLTHLTQEITLDIDLSKQIWSATSLKTYLECKRKYYLHYILGLKDHYSSLKPQAFELGSIIHKILEMLYSSNLEITYENLIKYFNEYKNENPFLKLDLEVWKLKLKDFIELEQKRLKNGLSIVNLEKAFLVEYRGIKLKGVIDRIDRVNDSLEIIDYKTSSSLKVDTLKTMEKTKDFQLEFYFLACKELYKEPNIKPYYYDLNNSLLKEEIVLQEKLDLLDFILDELHTSSVCFDKTQEKVPCQFCQFKTICDR